MKFMSRRSQVSLLVLSLLTGFGVNISSPTVAFAETDCSTAQRFAINTALSNGDIATAASAQRMCNVPVCDSINKFYVNYSGYLRNGYVEGIILDAYKTCLANESKPIKPIKPIKPKQYTTVKAPKIIGKAKVGQTLKVQRGSWSGTAKAKRTDWYVCKNPNTKPKANIVDAAIYNINFVPYPGNNCGTEPIQNGSSVKLLSKHKGKFLVLCQLNSDAHYWGYYCTTSVKVS